MPQASDVGSTLRVIVTATNAGGSTAATSPQSAIVAGIPPSNTALPSISGSLLPGQTLTASNGSWNGSPTSFAYRWRDCDSAGSNCVDIAGATGSTYVVQASDVGSTLRVVVTATNAGGSTAATSQQTVLVNNSPPSNTVLPVVSGTAQQGQTLTASNGSWTGSPTSFAYRWRDCDASGNSCVDIAGATGSTYLLVAADVGHTLRVVVTATNAGGSTASTSPQTPVVAGPPPANTVLPTVSGAVRQAQTLTVSNGSWTGSPTSFSYVWRDCDASGGNCVDIAGATASSYVLQSADVGHTVRAVVTAANANGGAAATSAQTAVVTAAAWTVASSITSGQSLAGKLAWTATVAGITTGQIQAVDFYIDGVLKWSEHLSPYFFNGDDNTLDTSTLANGSHTFTVVATANDGTTATSQTIASVGSGTGNPPSNTVLPVVSGTSQQGQTLTASNGSWTGSPTSFAYRWRDCDASGNSCVDIAGATGSTYLLVAADVGHTLRVVVTATNAAGSAAATSTQTGTVAAAGSAPTNTVLPVVSGTAQQGQTLTASNGSWTGSPTSFAYRWRDCDASGSSCVDIAAGTASTYVLQASDVGHTLRVVVTATNASGSTAATSIQTVTVAAAGGGAPANTVLPVVSGVAQQGRTLTVSNGSWTGSPTSFSYVWRDCDASGGNCVDIAGATASSYVLQSADVGHTVRAVVTAANANGGAAATSAQTAVVTAAAWTVASSITSGQSLAGKLAWTATVAGITTGQIQAVDFYIDGVLKWSEHLSPYFFNGDDNTLDTSTLANGSHTFTVVATANDGTTATSQTTATVSN